MRRSTPNNNVSGGSAANSMPSLVQLAIFSPLLALTFFTMYTQWSTILKYQPQVLPSEHLMNLPQNFVSRKSANGVKQKSVDISEKMLRHQSSREIISEEDDILSQNTPSEEDGESEDQITQEPVEGSKDHPPEIKDSVISNATVLVDSSTEIGQTTTIEPNAANKSVEIEINKTIITSIDIRNKRVAQQPAAENSKPVKMKLSQSALASTTNTTEAIIPPNKTSFLVWTTMPINREEPCDVSCTYTSRDRLNADASVYERRGYVPPSDGDKFSIYLQMEGEHYYPIYLNGYHLENSYRWQSPLLKPYFEWVHYHGKTNISNPAVSWNDTIDGATFIARNCNARNDRESMITSLRKAGILVDGLSSCLNTVHVNDKRNKLAMMRPYKFNLAFENGNVEDYVTEKVYQALASGTLPVYMGAPNIREFVPENSIIDVADFDFNVTLLAQHLKECMSNQTLYESYHAWRYKPLPEWFLQKFNFTWVTTECRTCRYLYALSNGLEWDKENQIGISGVDPS